MAFEKSIHLTDCKYRYNISPNVKNSLYVIRLLCKIKSETTSCTAFSKKCLTQAKVSHSKSLLTKT